MPVFLHTINPSSQLPTKMIWVVFLLCSTPVLTLGQHEHSGFFDNFERSTLDTTWNDESFTLWRTAHEDVYQLSPGDNRLNIEYSKDTGSDENAGFRLNLPEEIDVSENPNVTLKIRSDVTTTLTLRTVYSLFTDEFHEQELTGDDTWYTINFRLDEDYVENESIEQFIFYLDRGSTASVSGTIEMDYFKAGGTSVTAGNLQSTLVNSETVELQWETTDQALVESYNIYRSTVQGASYASSNKIGNITKTEYTDTGLQPWKFYYYSIAPVDTNGIEHVPETEIRQPVYDPESAPEISVSNTNTNEPGTYEKFEADIDLEYIVVDNPYDPEQVDLHAYFASPNGEDIKINGFYDDVNGRDQWKIRFAPDEPGEWEFQVKLENVGRIAETGTHHFTATESDHHGPLTVSPHNPDYLMHHDGTSFYGLAVYYPWNVTEGSSFTGGGLEELKDAGVNIFGYWNSTYDGAGNGGGSYLLESMDSGLGRYDQRKAGRIDEILGWAEERDMHMMYAVWAHDWLRIRGEPWNVDHSHWYENPYSDEFDPVGFYTDDEARQFQKNQYRYIIARWGHSRALGIWELVNEIHGTTGFDRDQNAAVEWSNWIHSYFKENDPYNRPTTIDYGDTDFYRHGIADPDMPNFHYYEAQGGFDRPYNDAVRDGLYNVVQVYHELKEPEGRPAILGEAGYYTMFSDANTHEYTEEFHNAYWSGVANGMASTPFWWEFNQGSIFTEERMETYGNIKNFISDLNFAHTPFEPSGIEFEGTKSYGMQADTTGFSWMWTEHENISNKELRFSDLENGTFELLWFDTWSGETITKETVVSADNSLPAITPEWDEQRRDIAFKTHRIENGTEAQAINLFFKPLEINTEDSEEFRLIAYISDSDGRLVTQPEHEITFNLSGPGELDQTSVTTSGGIAVTDYLADSATGGEISITAEAENIESASWSGNVITSADDRDNEAASELPDKFSLEQNYPNPFNPVTSITYKLPHSSQVNLTVYDVTGRKVQKLVNDYKSGGQYTVTFDAGNLSSGTYLYRLQADNFLETKRMMLIK